MTQRSRDLSRRSARCLALGAALACACGNGGGGSAANSGGAPSAGSVGTSGASSGGTMSNTGSGGTMSSAGVQTSGGLDATGNSGNAGSAGTANTSAGRTGNNRGGAGGRGPSAGGANTANSGGRAGGGGGGAATSMGGTATAGAANGDGLIGGSGFAHMERLNRGVVAVPVSGGMYVGWRMLGFEYDADDPASVTYDLYRDGDAIASITDSTNYLDASGTSMSRYAVRAVIGGTPGALSEPAAPWAQNYLRIPIERPGNIYSANDGSVGDIDGDGTYEIFLKWDPSDAQDNSKSGTTSDVFIDAIKLDGTRLWRIDLGPNIRAGAHYTQFVVYDFDGDGKAEMAVKTAPGTKDGKGDYLKLGPAADDDDTKIYRNAEGYVLSGPEYLTVFDGATGVERATVAFDVPRGTVASWGDEYGNRVDRFLASAAFLDDSGLASFIMARGYYERTTLTAWNFRDGKLTQLWKFDSNTTPKDAAGHPYSGQGSHSMTVGNVDSDPQLEILYGAMAIDHDGKGLCSTGFNHGDAEHVGDLLPSRPGLEFFMCNEDGDHPAYHVRDARTCELLQEGPVNGADTGRCVADDILASSPGAEMWSSSVSGLLSATTNVSVGDKPASTNFLIYWDADETRELEDGTSITKYGASGSLLTCSQCASNNGTKSTPTLTADLFGDWREEIIWRESNDSALRLYTTTAVTKRRIYTLMHDPQYRMEVSSEQTAYNQPPHPGFHIGNGMTAPPKPDITVR